MTPRRFFSWTLACLVLIGLIAAWGFSRQPVTIHARIAEDGGFMPDAIKAHVGEPIILRLISDDVEHGFAIGQSSMDPIRLRPGKPEYVTLTFDKPGIYTFYTTVPSSLNFWRMRGVIEVSGDGEPQIVEPPLYVRLGLELDEEHASEEEHVEFPYRPSGAKGELFMDQIPLLYFTREYYVAHSPMETFEELRSEPALQSLSDENVWNVVAYLWQQNTSSTQLATGKSLYQTNCAACHGENGAGDGQFAEQMKAIAEKTQDEHGIQVPTDFTDAEHLLEGKPAILQGLLLRGGMGTGMPMWGTIFTDEQTWDLVAYLYSIQFDYQGEIQ
jgi:mono/diheme cytochrome c family protein/plastocyanin